MSKGLRVPRRFTAEGRDPYAAIQWARRDSRITNPDGSVVFEVKDAEVPAAWSQVATDIIVSKYFRKAGVPQTDGNGHTFLGSETSARQVFDRLAGTWRWWGEKYGYFASAEDAQAFEDEMKYMLANQIASPNSPQWFNTGLAHAYGITGTPQGFWYVDPATGEMTSSPDAYTHPAPHACFPASARITTSDGFKPIEKIEPGDRVLTHRGRYQRVLEVTQRQVEEELVSLRISRLTASPFVSTANHPVLALRRSEVKRGQLNPQWLPAGDLQAGDYVISARPTDSHVIPAPVDLGAFVGPNFEVSETHLITRNARHRPQMKRMVAFDEPSLFRLFGRWLGDGSIGHETRDGQLSSVNFVFRGNDTAAQTDVLDLMEHHFGVTAPVERAVGQNTAHLRFVRRPLARFFVKHFGFGFAGKSLPGFVYELPSEHRLELLVGLFKSDGCTLKAGNATLMCFDQSNQELAEGIWRLLRSLGYSPAIMGGRVRPGGTAPHFRVTVSVKDASELAEKCDVDIPLSSVQSRFLRIGEDRAYRIQSTAVVPFFGTVYNFQVQEDESYVADGVVVHNCFINSVSDDLVNPGGIMDLWVREARLFKVGSGTGTNFSNIRAESEMLSGGGKSSGVMGFLRIGDRAAGAIKCLHADTDIVTDGGTFRIKDLAPGQRVMTRFGPRKIDAVHDNGVQPLVRITTALGDEMLCTPEHRFWVRNAAGEGWKEAKDLTDEDYALVDLSGLGLGTAQALKPIALGHHNEIEHELPTVLDEGFALWLGWMSGDGSITSIPSAKFLAIQIGDEDPELLDRYVTISKGVFGSKIHIFINRRADGRSDASASVRFSSSQVIRFLDANGLRKGRATETSIPDLVKSSPAAVRAAFLSGLFEADGHIDNGYPVLSTVSRQMARDVHRLLLGIGIPSTVKRQDIRTSAKGILPIHLVRVVGGEGVRRFAKLVGFISERKSAKLDAAVIRKTDSPYETQWILPHIAGEMNQLWQKASPSLRRALAPYCRYARPRSLSLLRASALMARFPEELAGSVVDRFALGNVAYQQLSVAPAGEGPVFDLTIQGVHEYSVHGLVTHNSGGTTRRAAKMVILDLDHPDVEEFIDWKKHEEGKARVLIQHGGYPADFNGEAYATVSGQNSNNSVRVPNEFIEAVRSDGDWELRERTSGKVRKTLKARDLWRKVAEAAWACADPGVQFDTIINEWHTSPAGGKIRATNPCFPGDTRIATDKGLIQFRDLVSRVTEGESFQVYTHDATGGTPAETVSLTTPTQFMITGKNQILRLEFSDGRVLRLTPNHRLWTANRGWVRADELSDTDQVRLLDHDIDFGMASWTIPIPSDPRAFQSWSSRKNAVVLPEKWTEEFAHYLGWLIGDGSLTDDTAVTVYGTEAEQTSVMPQHLRLLTEINGGVAPKPTKMGNGTYQLRLGRHAFMNYLEALGVGRGRAGTKKVPWAIFEAPKAIVASFLRGLYDADGCVRNGSTTRYVGLGSISLGLLRGVQQLLDSFGVHGSIYVYRESQPGAFVYVTKSGEERSYSGQRAHDLRVMGTDLEKFALSIGFLSHKGDLLSRMLAESIRYSTRHWVKLRSRSEDGWETTFNLTEPRNHSYLAESVIVSNCSEYVFIDDTACNLASINLIKFYDDKTGVFDTEAYEHAIRIWTIALEISVTMAHFPSREIAQGSYDYRTLGLGYANLGTLLMRMGLPYDSDAGRAVSAAITAVLTGYAYATSAELAASVGAFPRFAENREAMLRVIRNHRRATYDSAQQEYEGLSHYVMGINPDLSPGNLLTAARQSWDLALDMGERHGFRNAQVSVIAPTGCLVGDSLVPTELGLTRLSSLGDAQGKQWQDLGVKVGTDQGPQNASHFYINGVEPVVTVTTRRGYRVHGTPTHRIKVVGSDGSWVWKRFGEIQKADLVPLQLGQLVGDERVVRLSDIGEVTADVAELIGIVVGFGTVEKETLRIGGSNPTEVALLLKRVFGEEVPTTGEVGVTLNLLAKPRLRALAAFAGEGSVPDEILASNNPEIYKAFASHLIGVSIAERLARDLQNVELAIGRPSHLRDSSAGWIVSVDASHTQADFIFDEVVNAALGEEQPTFDLSVPANVTYVANGFVSHNTIGLQMDCDTTGVEPDFALVKFKKLAGGGYFKIVNQSVAPALRNLLYGEDQIEEIVRFIVGASSLQGAPHINRESLMAKGFNEEDLAKIEKALPAVFELKHAFNPFVLGEEAMLRLGFELHEYATFEFDLLRSLGFSNREVREATEWVCGQQTIEGAPQLRDEHLAVFDTANRNGRNGSRLIHHTGHIRMLAATQPFLSGAASKTINMPNEATIEDIEESYLLSYELGVKCMALYRDGSKASQPLSAGSDDAQPEDEPEEVTRAHEIDKQILWGKIPMGMSPTQAYSQGMHPPRFVLPGRRGGYTQEARIGGHKVYLRTGEYDDGTLGEVFIDLAKEGATLRGILSCFAIAVSKGLQFGVPLEEFVDTFTFQTFEPRGLVEGHPNIKMANSIVDYVFRALAVEYLQRDELAQVPPNRDGDLPEPKKGLALDAGVQLDLTDAVADQDVTAVASAVTFLDQGPVATKAEAVARVAAASAPDAGTRAMQTALSDMMGDAPLCDVCGHITIRNGSCYKCLNCGNSLGCS